MHKLRHSYATHMLDKGVGIKTISELLGHENSKTTEVYLSVSTVMLSKVPSLID